MLARWTKPETDRIGRVGEGREDEVAGCEAACVAPSVAKITLKTTGFGRQEFGADAGAVCRGVGIKGVPQSEIGSQGRKRKGAQKACLGGIDEPEQKSVSAGLQGDHLWCGQNGTGSGGPGWKIGKGRWDSCCGWGCA